MSSFATTLIISNHTRQRLTLAISEIDSGDWDGVSRPDSNLQGLILEPGQRVERREELNALSRSAQFLLTATFGNGDSVSFRVDQYQARSTMRGAITVDGAAALYEVHQSAGGDINRYTFSHRVDTAAWMDRVPGPLRLSELTLPGTHDTGTYTLGTGAVDIWGKTQTLSIRGQLDAGVRFLDIRCHHTSNRFEIMHGILHTYLDFGTGVRDVCYQFLDAHPSETIVMCIKPEESPDRADARGWLDGDSLRYFEDTLRTYLFETEHRWYLGQSVPTLDEVRGRIVLLRRFSGARGRRSTLGIDSSAWPDDCTARWTNDDGVKFALQDAYNSNDPGAKWSNVRSLLEATPTESPDVFCINYTSCVGKVQSSTNHWLELGVPLNLACGSENYPVGVNNYLFDWLVGQVAARRGTIPMDFPEEPGAGLLIRQIIAQNPIDPSLSARPRALVPVPRAPQGSVAGPTLEAGRYLLPGQYLLSPNGNYRLSFAAGCNNLVLERKLNNVWLACWAVDQMFAPFRLYMQDDGNLVLYHSPGNPGWASNDHAGIYKGSTRANFPGSILQVLDEGRIEVRAGDGSLLFVGGPPPAAAPAPVVAPAPAAAPAPVLVPAPPAPPSLIPPGATRAAPGIAVMLSGQYLEPGDNLRSGGGNNVLRYQQDGNLVLYGPGDSVLWTSNTVGRPAHRVFLSDDGALAILDTATTTTWTASALGGLSGSPYTGTYLRVQDDGNLEVRNRDGTLLWSSGSGNPPSRPWIPAAPASTAAVSAARSLALSGGYLQLPTLPSLGFTGQTETGYTIETWVLFDKLETGARIFDFGSQSGQRGNGVYLGVGAEPGQLAFVTLNDGVAQLLTPTLAVRVGVWTHVAVTVSPNKVASLYIDGALVATRGGVSSARLERAANFLGRSNWASDPPFTGRLSDFRIWHEVVSQPRLQARMRQRLEGNEANLAALFRLAEGNTGDVARDSAIGSARVGDGQLRGAVAWSQEGPAAAALPQSALPAPWTSQDIGLVAVTGAAAFADGIFTVSGAGAGMEGTEDSCRMVLQPASGDVEVRARLVKMTAMGQGTIAGVVIRETMERGARSVLFGATPLQTLMGVVRDAPGGATTRQAGAGERPVPIHLRITRRGDAFIFDCSKDGVKWETVGSVKRALAAVVQVGLVVCAGAELPCTAAFDNVAVTAMQPVAPAGPQLSGWRSQQVGIAPVGGIVEGSGDAFKVTAGCAKEGAAFGFHMQYQELSGDFDLRARVASLTAVGGGEAHPDAFAGVMLRESLDIAATAERYTTAAWIVRTAYGVQLEASGKFLPAYPLNSVFSWWTGPAWVRLTRIGKTVTCSLSRDGSGWSVVLVVELDLPAKVLAGLAVCGGIPGKVATASFDGVAIGAAALPVAPATLPAPWLTQTVGASTLSGGAVGEGSSLLVTGVGGNIWADNEAFQFTYQRVSAACELQAQVGFYAGLKTVRVDCGLMIRDSLDVKGRFGFLHYSLSVVELLSRTTPGDRVGSWSGNTGPQPSWFKIVWRGPDENLLVYFSFNGVNWEFLTNFSTKGWGANLLVGFAVCAGDLRYRSTARFDNVSLRLT